MEAVADPRARESGVAIGKAAAELALKAGGIDPAIAQAPYLPRAQPGVWVPTQLPVFDPCSSPPSSRGSWSAPTASGRPAAVARQRNLGARL